jgi:hypothetical protein
MWEQTFGGTGDDRAFFVESVEDGFVVVGSSTSFEQGKTVACAVRFDSNGNQLWNQTFCPNLGAEFRWCHSLQDGFWVAGNTFLPSGAVEGYVVKLDLQGNLLWNGTLKANEGINKLFSATTDQNGNLVVAGLTQPANNATASQAGVAKLDCSGNPLWSKTYPEFSETAARAVAVTENGFFMVAGYSAPAGTGNYDFLFFKLDPEGKTLPNSEFLVVGTTFSFGNGQRDFWLFKVDDAGREVWSGTVGRSGFEEAYAAVSADNGGFVLVGWTNSVGNGGRYDFYVVKIKP